MRLPVVLTLAVVLAGSAGCAREEGGSGSGRGGGGRLQVVATVYPLAEVATAVGGDDAEVVNLTPAGAEPHDVELTPDQVDRLEDADLILYLGEDFQPAVQRTVARVDTRAVDALRTVRRHLARDGGGAADPHVWLDPHLLSTITDHVAEAMSGIRPEARSRISQRAAEYRAGLEQLDSEFGRGLNSCRHRVVVTTHKAFGYLGRRYDLDMRAIAGLDPESEPNPARVAAVVDEIKALGVTTVFREPRAPSQATNTVAREAGADVAELDPVEGIARARLAGGDNYISVMRRNLEALRTALGCQ